MKNTKSKKTVSFLLAVLMLISAFALTPLLSFADPEEVTSEVESTEPESTEPETTEPETTEPFPDINPTPVDGEIPDEPEEPDPLIVADEFKIRVGLSFGTSVEVGYETVAANGFYIGTQHMAGDLYTFSWLWTTYTDHVAVIPQDNILIKGDTYSYAGTKTPTVGGYHIVLNRDFESRAALKRWVSDKNDELENLGTYAFPACVNGKLQLRIGAFSNSDTAAATVQKIMSLFKGYSFSVSSPSKTGLNVIDCETKRILYQYDSSDAGYCVGLYPIMYDDEMIFTKTSNDNIYKGVFAYKRYTADSVDGVAVTNVLNIEDYVEGVIPYEISNYWNMETLKSFAIAVRTYAYSRLNKHFAAYGFDVCNTSNCEVYRGMKRVNQAVTDAVRATEGMVIFSGDGLAMNTNYCASHGGVSNYSSEVWGGRDYPYLVAQLTPWEQYTIYSHSFWIQEITGKDLAKQIRSMGYTTIKDEIVSVVIDEYCRDSTYVKQITFTDKHGTTLTLTGPSNIRSVLINILWSGNFVVGKGKVDYTIGVYLPGTEPYYDPETGVVREPLQSTKNTVLSAVGSFFQDLLGGTILTADGQQTFGNYQNILRMQTENDTSVYLTATAEIANSFVFVGKGWGHGVGLSQYGSKDLGDLGYTAEEIVVTYFPGTTVVTGYYRENNAS